ncbi:hypothetical protein [Effusibacillus pohliae]|uniref:hypothetical protein n=1 Tax=Effusibacillus pohliae TaxID=232270 RepID=UPI0003660D1A|nr:hypothetical protein [Effusibacillus pohliae]
MAKQQPAFNLAETLRALAWLDMYLDSIQLGVGVPDLYHAVYGDELPVVEIDITDSEPLLLFEACKLLEKNGFQPLVQELFSVLAEKQRDVTTWTLQQVPNRKPK